MECPGLCLLFEVSVCVPDDSCGQVSGATDMCLRLCQLGQGHGGQVRRLEAALFNKITDAGVACVITQHQDIVGEDGLCGIQGWRGPLVHHYFFQHVPQAPEARASWPIFLTARGSTEPSPHCRASRPLLHPEGQSGAEVGPSLHGFMV